MIRVITVQMLLKQLDKVGPKNIILREVGLSGVGVLGEVGLAGVGVM